MKKRKLGISFPESVRKVSNKRLSFKIQEEDSLWKDNFLPNFKELPDFSSSIWPTTTLMLISILAFFVIFLRLFNLQIIQGDKNRQLAEGNRVQVKLIHAPRGVIYDRNGKILAANSPAFRLGKQVLTREEAIAIESKNSGSTDLEIDSVRSYPYGEKVAHALGYVSEITEDELKLPEFKGYKVGDRIGRGGVEESYEKLLRGVDGGEVIETDSRGEKLRTLRQIDPIPGKSLKLSLDIDLQVTAYDQLEKAIKTSSSCCGAAVVENPQTGEILSLVSYPSFDPLDVSKFLISENSPILNRALGGLYPPGSVFKIITSLAALSSGKITPSTQFEDTGVMYLGPFKFGNWYFNQYGKTEGLVDLQKALQRSNDIYFYNVGQTIGEDQIAKTAKLLGLGKKVGVDIPGEVAGVIPDGKWKKDNIGEIWFPGDTLHMAIGQGFILVTPLQISNLISQIAANKIPPPPHLYQTNQKDTKLSFKQEDLDNVKAGLSKVTKFGGTAWPFFTFPISSAGKTGTAEFGDPKNRTHAWYTAFAPEDNPQIATTVLIEAGGEGSTNASPVAKEIMRYFFSSDKKNLIKDGLLEATPAAKQLGE